MNIYKIFIDMSSEIQIDEGEIYLESGRVFRLDKINPVIMNIENLINAYGNKIVFDFKYSGDFLLRAGVASKGKSFKWIQEKHYSSYDLQRDFFEVDIAECSGVLELFLMSKSETRILDSISDADELKVDEEKVLQRFIFPTFELCCEEPLYFRTLGNNIFYSFDQKCISMGEGSSLDLQTYFNSFSAKKWRKYSNVRDINCFVDLIGYVTIDVVYFRKDAQNILFSRNVYSNKRSTYVIQLKEYPDDGIIGIIIHAKSDSIFFGGGFYTDDIETQNVHLGIGITTYKREQSVKQSIRRLHSSISNNKVYKHIIDIIVVDNGRSVSAKDVDGAKLIPNKNLGGTGGFMRSLLDFKEKQVCTHCLFMDDDAFCEPESIFRSISFLKHANTSQTAISGAMLSENIQFLQWENGAWFDKTCHPMHCNFDLRQLQMLYENEIEDTTHKKYGAWWFFMFPLSENIATSFPYFVRGDDVAFSYINDFEIVNMNSICVWQEDFKTKESPLTHYLDVRSHFVNHLLVKHLSKKPSDLLSMLWRFVYYHNNAYHYDTANACIRSFNDILQGDKYWIDNIDTSIIRKNFKKDYIIEVPEPMPEDTSSYELADKNIKFSPWPKTIRKYTLNGHLLPKFIFSKKKWKISKYDMPNPARMFLRDDILVFNENVKTYYKLKMSRTYYFKNIVLFLLTAIKFKIFYGRIIKNYNLFFIKTKQFDFWKKIFNQ